MNKRIKFIFYILMSVLMLAVVVPQATHAGTVSIYNKNCTHTKGLYRKKWVTVHVRGYQGCTNTKVQVRKGSTKVVNLIPTSDKYVDEDGSVYYGPERTCKYKHEAKGTLGGKRRVSGKENSSVTCKRDWARVCQCTKD